MSSDSVLIVVPCLNEAAHLPDLLAQLIAQAPDALVVVADGGSMDGSREIVRDIAARHDRVVLLENPARLQSAGVNLAVARYAGAARWLVRLDAHCGYPPDYVRGLIAAAARNGADSVVVPMRTAGKGCFQKAAAAAQNSVLGTGGSAHRHVGVGRFVDHGHHALFSLAQFRAVGGYDEGFVCNEDAELDHRLGLAGAKIWLEPTLALDYTPRDRPSALWRQYYRYGVGRAMTVARHRMPMKLRQMVPLAVPPALLLAIGALFWWPLALPALAWALLCLAVGVAIGVRARDGCAALSGVAAMLMHAAWSLGFLRQRLTRRVPPARTMPPS